MKVRVRYISLAQAAAVLGVTPGTLARWATEGKVPAYKTPGGQWRFVEADLVLALKPRRPQRGGRS